MMTSGGFPGGVINAAALQLRERLLSNRVLLWQRILPVYEPGYLARYRGSGLADP